MRPDEGHRGVRRPAEAHAAKRQVRPVPNLLGYETDASTKILDCPRIGFWLAAGRKVIVTPLGGEKRPRPASPPIDERRAVIALTVAVMVIAPPARPMRSLHLQYRIHDLDRVLHDGVVRAPYSITNQLEKARIHNVLGRVFVACAGRLIRQCEGSAIGILICAAGDVTWINPDVVAADPRHESAFCRNRPALDVRLEKIRVVAQESRCDFVVACCKELGPADQRSDMRSEGRRRVTLCFLPAILWRNRPLPDEKSAGATNHFKWIEVAQCARFPMLPREQDRKRNFIQLHTCP